MGTLFNYSHINKDSEIKICDFDKKKKSDDKLKKKYGDKEFLKLRSLVNGLSRNRKELNNIKDSTELVHIERAKVLTDAINRMENDIKDRRNV